jgi:hypothetical protein
MKTKYFLIIALLFSFTTFVTFAQKTEVPKVVKDSFSKLYPKVKDVKWDKEGKEFEASFKVDKKDKSVLFDGEGNVLETETAIELSQLPSGIDKYVAENYKGYKISGAAKIVKAKGETTYEAEVTKGKERKDLIFDANGKPEKKDVNKEKEENEDEED